MNGLMAAKAELDLIVSGSATLGAVDLLICPPATLIARFAAATLGSSVAIGGQDCHALPCGAHTGDISAEMLRDAGATAVIVGHSERRQDHHESDAEVRAKAEAAHRAGLLAIVCVGETRAERDAGRTRDVVARQIAGSLPEALIDLVIAYEPVWAIGAGLTPTPVDIAEIHRFLRTRLAERYGPKGAVLRILYGGSVKPGNARELLTIGDVDGVLVGGASLVANDFLAIARAAAGAV